MLNVTVGNYQSVTSVIRECVKHDKHFDPLKTDLFKQILFNTAFICLCINSCTIYKLLKLNIFNENHSYKGSDSNPVFFSICKRPIHLSTKPSLIFELELLY